MSVSTIETTIAGRDRDYVGVPGMTTMVRRICRTYREASGEALVAGIDWYGRVGAMLEKIADAYRVDLATVAGVFAATSPRVTVTRNVWLTLAILQAERDGRQIQGLPALTDRLRAAEQIVRGDLSGLFLDADGRLTGSRKVRSFWANLLGDEDAVTVDVWAARVAGVDLDQPSGGAYVAVAEAYRRAASRLGVSAPVVQAVTWCAFRQDADGTDALAELETLEVLVTEWIATFC